MTARPVIVLGGSFDPVHRGHLALIDTAQQSLGVSRGLFLLSPAPPHKPAETLTPARHREAMLELAIADRSDWELCRLELERPELRYTLDTLRALREMGEQPIFALGMDSVRSLTTWRHWEELVEQFDLVVLDRAPSAGGSAGVAPELVDRLTPLAADAAPPEDPGAGGRIFLLPVGTVDASSSEIRRLAREDGVLEDLVPSEVARYIRGHRLYRQEESVLSTALPPPVRRAVEAAADRLAQDVLVLDLRGRSDVTDYFVICHGNSDRQVQAIVDHVASTLRDELRVRAASIEGRRGAGWILMDYIDFVLHVFDEPSREFYRLERLWGDAPQVDISDLLPEEPRPDFDRPDGGRPASGP